MKKSRLTSKKSAKKARRSTARAAMAELSCPLRELLTRFGDKWSILVVITLDRAPERKLRFTELKNEIETISQRMLTATLRNLERDGVVKREVFGEIPPRVEYQLTDLGGSLFVPIRAFVNWIETNWCKIEKNRAGFDDPS